MSGDSNTYNQKREGFGGKINFKSKEEQKPQDLSFKADLSLAKNFEYKNPKTITLGNIAEKSSHLIHTEKTKVKSTLIKHTEGGWPDSVKDPNEHRDVQNWKRAKEKLEDFPIKVKTLIANTTQILRQNLRMDIYEDYFDENVNVKSEDNFSAKIKTVFKDTETARRSVNKVVYSTDEEQSKIAVAYRLHKDELTPPNYKFPVRIYIYSIVSCMGHKQSEFTNQYSKL